LAAIFCSESRIGEDFRFANCGISQLVIGHPARLKLSNYVDHLLSAAVEQDLKELSVIALRAQTRTSRQLKTAVAVESPLSALLRSLVCARRLSTRAADRLLFWRSFGDLAVSGQCSLPDCLLDKNQ